MKIKGFCHRNYFEEHNDRRKEYNWTLYCCSQLVMSTCLRAACLIDVRFIEVDMGHGDGDTLWSCNIEGMC